MKGFSGLLEHNLIPLSIALHLPAIKQPPKYNFRKWKYLQVPAYLLQLVSLWVYISLLTAAPVVLLRNKGTTTVMKGPFTCGFTLVIARLSKDISEQRKSTRIVAFSLLICLTTTKFTLLKLLYPYKETICLKFWANLLIFEKPCLRKIIKDVCMYVCMYVNPLSKNAKHPFPDDMHRSKMPLLKLPLITGETEQVVSSTLGSLQILIFRLKCSLCLHLVQNSHT